MAWCLGFSFSIVAADFHVQLYWIFNQTGATPLRCLRGNLHMAPMSRVDPQWILERLSTEQKGERYRAFAFTSLCFLTADEMLAVTSFSSTVIFPAMMDCTHEPRIKTKPFFLKSFLPDTAAQQWENWQSEERTLELKIREEKWHDTGK